MNVLNMLEHQKFFDGRFVLFHVHQKQLRLRITRTSRSSKDVRMQYVESVHSVWTHQVFT